MFRRFTFLAAAAGALWPASASADGVRLVAHESVNGGPASTLSVDLVTPTETRAVDWRALSSMALSPGRYKLRLAFAGGEGLHLEVPPCAGRNAVRLDGKAVQGGKGPLVLPLPPRAEAHQVEIDVRVSTYERRIACGYAPRYGAKSPADASGGFALLTFPSSARGGGQAVVYVPRGLDRKKPAPLLVGAHPWGGDAWTYAAYAELLAAADARSVVLLFPSGLGNSLYTEEAENEVVRAMDALAQTQRIDDTRVSIWGASMGGAGATTIGFHRPDRFASVVSLFGDSKYDLGTYVRPILVDEAGAHRVNALDVVDNARHLDVWLIHGDADRVSPVAQSAMLDAALRERGFRSRFDKVERAGHDGSLVARFAGPVVEKAASAQRPRAPSRVTFRSVRSGDTAAYGVRIVRAGKGDAFIDVEREASRVVIRRAVGIRSVELGAPFVAGADTGPEKKPLRIERAEEVSASVDVRVVPEAAPSASSPERSAP